MRPLWRSLLRSPVPSAKSSSGAAAWPSVHPRIWAGSATRWPRERSRGAHRTDHRSLLPPGDKRAGHSMGALYGASTSDIESYRKVVPDVLKRGIPVELTQIAEPEVQRIWLETKEGSFMVDSRNRGGGRWPSSMRCRPGKKPSPRQSGSGSSLPNETERSYMDAHVLKSITRPPRDLIRQFEVFDTATVHEASGGAGALSSDIKPVDPLSRLCGPAVTVFCRPGDNLILHKAIYVAEPGDVLVVTVGGYEEAGPWGEIMSFAAQVEGYRRVGYGRFGP